MNNNICAVTNKLATRQTEALAALEYVAVHSVKLEKTMMAQVLRATCSVCVIWNSLSFLKPGSAINFTPCHCAGRQSEDQERDADGRPVFLPFLDLPHGA